MLRVRRPSGHTKNVGDPLNLLNHRSYWSLYPDEIERQKDIEEMRKYNAYLLTVSKQNIRKIKK